ncbi:hypothetical protein AB0D86_47805 [Streptomyces sp. NPDC048324]|uniref:protein kinase domain-containing protein n=1 Tax=Streptomyces sp. NPDC048324 TaxID=3157205 RepID=UPI0034499F8F
MDDTPTDDPADGAPPPRTRPSPLTRRRSSGDPPQGPMSPAARALRSTAATAAPAGPDRVPSYAPPRVTIGRRRTRRPASGEFPEELRDRYTPLGLAGSGSEGTVWHVRRIADSGDAAVKIAHPTHAMDMSALEHLSSPEFQRHVPVIYEFGEIEVGASICGWVAMEYLPTTLDEHLARELPGEKRYTGRTVHTIRELTDLLDFWQTRVERNPLDLTPTNILVRPDPGGQPEFVVADFGAIAKFTTDQSYREFQLSVLYMAPEQMVNQNLRATPWWTLGLMLYQVFTGRPLNIVDGNDRINDESWVRSLILYNEVDLSAVTDARWRLLLQGLLTKDPDDRWTGVEVRSWLNGGSPQVVRPFAPAPPAVTHHANRPIVFRGVTYHEAEHLAAAMARHSEAAAEWLAGNGGPRLAAWLRDDLGDTSYDSSQLLTLARGANRAVRAAVAALEFVATYAPTASPQYRGRRVDAEGIARIARGSGAVPFIDELLGASVPAIAARFTCHHGQCTGGRCKILLTLADELPRTIEAVRAEARALGHRGQRGTGGGLSPYETERAYALTATSIVHPRNRRDALFWLTGLPTVLAPGATSLPLALLVGLVHLAALRDRAVAVLHRRREDGGFLHRWADLHRRAADSAGAERERTALVAAVTLVPRTLRTNAIRLDYEVTFAELWSTGMRSLWCRLRAAAVLFTVFWLLIWSGAMLRVVHDVGLGWRVLKPADALAVPLTRAADTASAAQSYLCAVALAGAVAFAVAPVRMRGGLLLAGPALAAYAGYTRPNLPPLDKFPPPDRLVEALHRLLGGWHSWNGVIALVFLPLVCLILVRVARRLLYQARAAEQQQAAKLRRRAKWRRERAAYVHQGSVQRSAAAENAGDLTLSALIGLRREVLADESDGAPYQPDADDAWLLAEPAIPAASVDLPAEEVQNLILLTDQNGVEQIPGFQFDPESGAPYPVVVEINRLLSADEDPWGAADWWLASNVWLDTAPARLLGTGVDDALRSAAQAEIPDW